MQAGRPDLSDGCEWSGRTEGTQPASIWALSQSARAIPVITLPYCRRLPPTRPIPIDGCASLTSTIALRPPWLATKTTTRTLGPTRRPPNSTSTPSSPSPALSGGPALLRATTKSLSEYYDPCQDAATRSIRCLHRNGGDRDLCRDYFQAYRDCKKQWMEARKKSKSG
ncbi:hypothetical protein BC567DRAFT_18007 [Phyllosticta citribraziliensis]